MNSSHLLKHPLVSDLYWLCYSPSLMQGLGFADFPRPELAWFLQLEDQPLCLEMHIQRRTSFLLGAYYEALWEYLLDFGPYTDLLAKNVQVFAGEGPDRKTLGEMDFIYFCHKRSLTVHLEVAVKFYIAAVKSSQSHDSSLLLQCDALSDGDRLALAYWVGPQCNDRLDIKYFKLRDKQSRLAFTPEAQQLLLLSDISVDVSEVAMQGRFFSPVGRVFMPVDCNPEHLTGIAMPFSACSADLPASRAWKVLDKPFWLSDGDFVAGEQNTLDREAVMAYLQRHFSSSDRAVMLLSKDVSGNLQRYFITASHWPKHGPVTEHLFTAG